MRSTARKESFLIARLNRKPDFPKSSWHGWTLHVVSVVAAIWFPLAAVLTPANVALSPPTTTLLREVSAQVRFVLGDRHYNTPELHENRDQADRLKVPTRPCLVDLTTSQILLDTSSTSPYNRFIEVGSLCAFLIWEANGWRIV